MEKEAAHSPSLSEAKLFKGRHLSCGFKKEKEILGNYLLAFLHIIIWFKPFSNAKSQWIIIHTSHMKKLRQREIR